MGAIYYHTSVDASGAAAAAREIQVGRFSPTINVNLNISLSGQADLLFLAPTYHLRDTSVRRSIIGNRGKYLRPERRKPCRNADRTSQETRSAERFRTPHLVWRSISDLEAEVEPRRQQLYGLRRGRHSGRRLQFDAACQSRHRPRRHRPSAAAIPISNPATGNEFSGVGGFTYNFINPDTNYQSGIDFHFDWGTSHFMSKQLFVGLVGYVYQQVTDDFGQNPVLGGFRSRVLGLGPQIGYIFPIGDNQAFLGLKGYREFAAENRPSGWNTC